MKTDGIIDPIYTVALTINYCYKIMKMHDGAENLEQRKSKCVFYVPALHALQVLSLKMQSRLHTFGDDQSLAKRQ